MPVNITMANNNLFNSVSSLVENPITTLVSNTTEIKFPVR